MEELRGDRLRTVLEWQIKAHTEGLAKALASYDRIDAFRKWHATIRAIEEFVNILTVEITDEDLKTLLTSIRLDDRLLKEPQPLAGVVNVLRPLFEDTVVRRFVATLVRTAAINHAFSAHGFVTFGHGISMNTVGEAVIYYQSRRRQMVTLLYMMPQACSGDKELADIDTLNVMLPLVELNCIALTSLYQNALLADIYPDFCAWSDGTGMTCSHQFQPLEQFFLEPERASLLDISRFQQTGYVGADLEVLPEGKVFAALEVRNTRRVLLACYAEFGLEKTEFGPVSEAIVELLKYCLDDYFIAMRKRQFQQIVERYGRDACVDLEELLVNRSTAFAAATNSFRPLVELGDILASNVNLLGRFLYAFKNACLDKQRKYQVRAGFLFEDMVKEKLAGFGFDVTEIKRINRKEFDVVSTFGDTVYNIQCKNNQVDLTRIETQRKAFVRYNRYLISYYKRALAKEKRRERLLLDKLGRSKIRHFVVSRFPVMTDHSEIIPYNSIERLATIMRQDAS